MLLSIASVSCKFKNVIIYSLSFKVVKVQIYILFIFLPSYSIVDLVSFVSLQIEFLKSTVSNMKDKEINK